MLLALVNTDSGAGSCLCQSEEKTRVHDLYASSGIGLLQTAEAQNGTVQAAPWAKEHP